MATMQALADAVLNGQRKEAVKLTGELKSAGHSAREILDQALVVGMDEVGRRFKCNEMYMPEVLIAAKSMKESMVLLEEELAATGGSEYGVAVLGTVEGDLHDIGKNLVGMMFRGAGIEVVDLGVDVSPEKFVEAAKQHKANIVGVSALLTTTMESMRDVVEKVKSSGGSSYVMVGGAPVTKAFADEIGAHGYAADAATGVDVARELIAKK